MSTNMLQNLPVFPLMWILIIVGWYVINRIIKYIKSKPIGTQTLLDGLYVQLLQKWTFEGFMYAMICTLVELQHTSTISSIIVGWGTYLAIMLSSVHSICCLFYRIILIFSPDFLENVEDKKILTITRYVYLVLL